MSKSTLTPDFTRRKFESKEWAEPIFASGEYHDARVEVIQRQSQLSMISGICHEAEMTADRIRHELHDLERRIKLFKLQKTDAQANLEDAQDRLAELDKAAMHEALPSLEGAA